MFVKTYENLDSSAVNTLKVDKSSVFVTYQSNIDKEYEFTCENKQEFDEKVSNTLKNKESIGKLLNVSLSLIHISEPTRPYSISYAVFCLTFDGLRAKPTSPEYLYRSFTVTTQQLDPIFLMFFYY